MRTELSEIPVFHLKTGDPRLDVQVPEKIYRWTLDRIGGSNIHAATSL
ncbi:MAG TPA: hypothetical protein PLG04_04455 [Anaerolineaceae bacterium]|nr:hypothetical protein [Anaerolineaceae bacterium]